MTESVVCLVLLAPVCAVMVAAYIKVKRDRKSRLERL